MHTVTMEENKWNFLLAMSFVHEMIEEFVNDCFSYLSHMNNTLQLSDEYKKANMMLLYQLLEPLVNQFPEKFSDAFASWMALQDLSKTVFVLLFSQNFVKNYNKPKVCIHPNCESIVSFVHDMIEKFYKHFSNRFTIMFAVIST